MILLVFLFSHAQTLRHRMGGTNSMEHGLIPNKKEEYEGNQQQTDGHDTIYNPPYQHNRSPPYILFPLSLENGLRKPPKAPGSGRACVRLYYASKHRLSYCIHVYGGRMCKMGFEGRKGKEGTGEQRRDPSIDRAAALLAKVWDVLYS